MTLNNPYRIRFDRLISNDLVVEVDLLDPACENFRMLNSLLTN